MSIHTVIRAAIFFLISASFAPAFAQTGEHIHGGNEQHHVDARKADEAPVIDGVLDEAIWREAAMTDSFTQQEPLDGAPATERTEVLVLYDEEHLYIGVRAFDSSPSALIATEMRRDSPRLLDEDNFQIILDTFRDSRSGYMFVTNPLGAKLEQQVFDEGGGTAGGAQSNVNRDWNGVWDAAARRTADGWVAEIVIPMVTVRSPEVDVQTWGINFMRNIRRKNEQVYWAPIPKPYGLTRVSLAGTVSGMAGVTRGLDLRLKPFVIVGGRRDRSGASVSRNTLQDVGLDAKYGLTSSLTLDVTANTDFAQAEVDEQQVNLTRFALFFPEKRDFFLENSGQFTIANESGNTRLASLFFSRRIGLSAAGQPVPLLGGARLTGKVGAHNVALMQLQTGEAFGRPGENFLVARYSNDIGRRSRIGGLVINKEAVDSPAFNRTFAADALIAPTPSFLVHTFLARTASPGVADNQQAFHTRVQFENSKWNTRGEFTDIEENFNAEVGFVPRTGIRHSTLHIERNPRPGGLIRVMEPMFNIQYTTDQHNRLITRRLHHMLGTRFQNGAYLNVVLNRWLEVLDEPFAIQRDVTIPAGVYRFHEWNLAFNTNPARRFYERFQYSPQTFYNGTRHDVNAAIGVRATSRMSAEFALSRNDVDLPWGAFVVNLGILRFDYTLSPKMAVRSLSQYNSSTRQFSTSIRYNFIFRPGSDLYVVYDGLDGNLPGRPELRNQQLVVKMTYLVSR